MLICVREIRTLLGEKRVGLFRLPGQVDRANLRGYGRARIDAPTAASAARFQCPTASPESAATVC